VLVKSAGAMETFGEINKARIYKELVKTKQRRRECFYTLGDVTSCLCFDYFTRWAAQWEFII